MVIRIIRSSDFQHPEGANMTTEKDFLGYATDPRINDDWHLLEVYLMMQRHPALHCQAQDSIAIRSFLLHGIRQFEWKVQIIFGLCIQGTMEKDDMLQVLPFLWWWSFLSQLCWIAGRQTAVRRQEFLLFLCCFSGFYRSVWQLP